MGEFLGEESLVSCAAANPLSSLQTDVSGAECLSGGSFNKLRFRTVDVWKLDQKETLA